MATEFTYIGKGLYSVPETRRLTGIPSPTLSRWVRGYVRNRASGRVAYPPLINSSLPPVDEEVALSFRDLMELRFINRLRLLKVSWHEIKATIDAARALLNTDYPFGTRRFATDGRWLFSEIVGKPGFLLRLRTRQITADQIFSPDLYAEIEFEHEQAARWRPSSQVVIDPRRSFGKPILDREGIPTTVIKRLWDREEKSTARVADWFEISDEAVQAAVDFELKLVA